MLTQNRLASVATPQSSNFDVRLPSSGKSIGKIQAFLVCDLHTDDRATAEALGLRGRDDCFMYDGQVYADSDTALAQVNADYLNHQ
jgi:hypothetical protein